jgi:hypothetical protein
MSLLQNPLHLSQRYARRSLNFPRCGGIWDRPGDDTQETCQCTWVIPRRPAETRNYFLAGPRGLSLANTPINGHPTRARPAIKATTVNISTVDYDRFKTQIRQCECSRGQPCEKKDEPRRFRVPLTCIDCTTWVIRRTEGSDEFMALSYI